MRPRTTTTLSFAITALKTFFASLPSVVAGADFGGASQVSPPPVANAAHALPMPRPAVHFSRRHFLRAASGAGACQLLAPSWLRAARGGAAPYPEGIRLRRIPSTGVRIPAIGMGTYITFNVGASDRLRADRAEVLRMFFQLGGGMIDSSPMYGSSPPCGAAQESSGMRIFGRTSIFSVRSTPP